MPNPENVLLEHKIEDMAGRRALAEPTPGPLKDAFSLAPDIAVGPYKVRRFRDGDFRILSAINHPLGEFLRSKLMGDESAKDVPVASKIEEMRQLSFIFTRPAKESAEIIKAEGVAGINSRAEDEFEELRMSGFSEIVKAIIEQARIYATANIEYGPAEKEGEDGASRPNPPSSEAQ